MTLQQALSRAYRELSPIGDDAQMDARLFVCHAAGIDPRDMLLHLRDELGEQSIPALEDMIRARLRGEPAQYIVGTAQFLGHEFLCDARALIPRFETEQLAQEAIALSKAAGYARALDLCTGSGVLAVSLAAEGLRVDACDLSGEALGLARENARRFGAEIDFYQGDLFEALPPGACYDLIVSNPPYIPTGEIADLQAEVNTHEPHMALDGGGDGLDFYRRIAREAVRYITQGGAVLCEIGQGQGDAVIDLFAPAFEEVDILPDMRGIARVLRAVRRKTYD